MTDKNASRRQLMLYGAAAVAAAVAGVGAAWWKGNPQPHAEAASDLWTRRFAKPDGGELAMTSLRGRPLVINFWATWCAPCLIEMPQIDRFHREFGPRGWQVLGLAIDQAEPVREFLTKLPVGFTIALGGFEGSEVASRLGNSQGALPFTVMFDGNGQVRWRHLGQTTFEALSEHARKLSTSP
jgi:thiol-disulfide isomerase/thioredoxin